MSDSRQAELSPPAPNKRLQARRAAFLKAARAVFEEKGYADTTLDDVIARSGGSRQTLYALFGGKQGLFEAIISDSCETIFRGLTRGPLKCDSLKDLLEQIGTRYLMTVTSPSCVNLNRLIISVSPRMPDLAALFWDEGPGRTRAFLTTAFEKQIRKGMKIVEPRFAADHFLEMLAGTIRLQCLIGLRPPPEKAEIKKIVNAAVARFMESCTTPAAAI